MRGESASAGTTGRAFPQAPLFDLDTVWFQVAGTLCNLRCTHCFISCTPKNHSHEMLSLETVLGFLDEARSLGVREYYFTGGEPFMNRDLLAMLEATLRQGPATVLTNGLLIRNGMAERLKQLADASRHSLDLRVSIDGYDAATNDPIRGAGTFERVMRCLTDLARVGLAPVITVSEACDGAGSREGRERFLEMLAGIGLKHPRLKILPLLRLGAEESRSRAYEDCESLAGCSVSSEQARGLVCSSGRMVTSQGVFVCPILIDFPAARMGTSLADTLRPFTLSYRACFTCHRLGLSCTT
ncbi:MAG: radical SAM protein [Acidobacteriota bacterium]